MMRKSLLALGTAMMVLVATPMDAEAQKLMHNPNAIEWEQRGNDKKIEIVEAETPSGMAISAYTKKRKTNPWDIALYFDLDDGIKKGEKISVSMWVRTAKAAKGQDTAEFVLFVGRNEEPYDYIISENVLPETEWKLITIEGIAEANMPDDDIKVEFQLAKHKQKIEFGPIFVNNMGPASE